MKLTYRGVEYSNVPKPQVVRAGNQEIIYRGNSSKARITPKFPWFRYLKQLFNSSEPKPVYDPITFWYEHKRKFVEDCWLLDDVEQLNYCWYLTQQIERNKLRSRQKIKLKYRGVTYYR
ncbi:DUF4278 domain-containing protein [Pleurocapsales cyanobacterium LEGE 10410]|nr:DUF4278 domain-containing protein [Pleurocapsales cyanobacterium LEGE 10410]